jgi:hypothetical protein
LEESLLELVEPTDVLNRVDLVGVVGERRVRLDRPRLKRRAGEDRIDEIGGAAD